MDEKERDKPEDFTKPSRQNRNDKRRRSQVGNDKAPKEIYKRQRINRNDVNRSLDDESDEY